MNNGPIYWIGSQGFSSFFEREPSSSCLRDMFFKKKSPREKLQKKYEELMSEAYSLSTKNRSLSDAKYAEADAVLKEMDKLSN